MVILSLPEQRGHGSRVKIAPAGEQDLAGGGARARASSATERLVLAGRLMADDIRDRQPARFHHGQRTARGRLNVF